MEFLNIATPVASFIMMLAVVELIRKGRLKEKYALLWLFSSIVIFAVSLSRKTLEWASQIVGIHYPPSFLFLIAFGFLVLINLHFSTVVSELSETNKRLAQEIALIKAEIKK